MSAARCGEVSVTAADSTTVSGCTVTVIRWASWADVTPSCSLSMTGCVIRSSCSSGA